MVVTFSGRRIIKKTKICLKILMLAIIVFYILPKLIYMLWYIYYPEPKMREDHLLERPLRVAAGLLEIG